MCIWDDIDSSDSAESSRHGQRLAIPWTDRPSATGKDMVLKVLRPCIDLGPSKVVSSEASKMSESVRHDRVSHLPSRTDRSYHDMELASTAGEERAVCQHDIAKDPNSSERA